LKSLQWRLALIHLLLILLAMELVNVYLLQSLERYYVNNFSSNLAAQAQVIAGFSERYLLQEKGREDLDRMVKEFGRQTGVDVAILSTTGSLLATSRENPDTLRYYLSREDVARALAGSRVENIRVDPLSGERYLHLTLGIRSAGSPLGVVYLTASLEGTYRTLQDIRWILLSAVAVALLITGLLSFLLAKTITDPLRRLTSRAEEIARGNFDQEIKINSGDEIGQLGEMFNYLSRRLKQTLAEISGEKEKMEAVLTHMADGLIALDDRQQPVLINPAAAKLLGSPGGVRAELSRGLEWLLQGLEGLDNGSRILSRREPTWQVLRVNVARLGQGEEAKGTVVVLQDITQQERLEALRRDFVANVSHELKTPLTTIKSYVETLLDGALEDGRLARQFLQVVEGETNRMVRLVQDLLQLSLMDSQSLRWQKARLDLAEVVEDVLAAQQVNLEKKGLILQQELEGGLPVWADRDRLEQVLLNLLSNAASYTAPGGTVTVSVRKVDRTEVEKRGLAPNLATQEDWALVTVADTGIGIPPEDLERVFERFYRVDKARSRQQGGTGLGLSIARQIVEAHGGRIGLTSALGRGTEVFFVLPLYQKELEGKEGGE